MILEYDEFCMFLLNIEVFNIMTPDFPYTSENETKCTMSVSSLKYSPDFQLLHFYMKALISAPISTK
jgi:hypothetical protein